jgi:lipoprotein NlpD
MTEYAPTKTSKMSRIFIAILALGTLAGCSTRNGPPANVHYDTAVSPYHTVKKGDSIASIAKKYGMDKRELIRVNALKTPYKIVSGQRLLVRPHAKAAPQDQDDDMESPATEEVGNVPDEKNVHIKPLAPVTGISESKGFSPPLNNEDDEDDSAPQEQGPREEEMDTQEDEPPLKSRRSVDKPSRIPEAPPAEKGYIWPAKGTVVRDFNPQKGKNQNDGINISAARGTPVIAANNGVVAHAGNQLRGFGNVVLVKHDNGTMTVYAHLDKVFVKKGDVVKARDKLGTVGESGTVKDPQLHFEIRKGRKPIDPNQYLR